VNTSDKSRIESIRKGDIKEYEKFFREYYMPLLSYAKRFFDDSQDAEEIVQELFFKLWENRARLEITSSLSSYLFRAVRNNCLQALKYQKNKTKYQKYIKAQGTNYSDSDQFEAMKYIELNEKVNRLLEDLPDRCQEIFRLNRFQGLKYKEIAVKLSISIKTVEANMSKALKHFRTNLKEYTVKS
jgi:RNA polymerase sigma-70 factor (ECF subfamily)